MAQELVWGKGDARVKEQVFDLISRLEASDGTAPLSRTDVAAIKLLLAKSEAQEAMVGELVNDFMSYATDGVANPAPYCANCRPECCARPGWCQSGSPECRGFYPAAAPRLE